MISPSYCGDFEDSCPGRCEPNRPVDEAEEILLPRGDTIIADHTYQILVHVWPHVLSLIQRQRDRSPFLR